MYYSNKLDSLKDIFGTENINIEPNSIEIGEYIFPIINDVIILLDSDKYPMSVKSKFDMYSNKTNNKNLSEDFADDIQHTFGEEWKQYKEILKEHEIEFNNYFDIVNINELKNNRVCDLGCGIGRWAYYLKDRVREIILVDFSEAIFEARENLKEAPNVLYFMADLKKLPFRRNFADFIYCVGVLHHLPTPALDEVRQLAKYSPKLLVYLYYALDNRSRYFKFILFFVSIIRSLLSRVQNHFVRLLLTEFLMWTTYIPLIILGKIVSLFGLGRFVPLFEGYSKNSLKRIRQDVYDRFFTRIEQRFTRDEIYKLHDTFSEIKISNKIPYWHFRCDV